MASPEQGAPGSLNEIADLLACPSCRGELRILPDAIECAACRAAYGFHQGIPLFARKGSAETWGGTGGDETSEAYCTRFTGSPL